MGFARGCAAVKAAGWAEDRGRRPEMEDGFVFVDRFGGRPSSAFFAVYDGHGGRQVVDYVTRELHQNVLRELRKGVEVPEALLTAFAKTDDDMVQAHIMASGCTACVCLLQEERHGRVIYTAHLGDSRAVMARGGQATRLTSMTDHKATDPLEAKRVIEAGGHIENDRVNGMLAMTRALGDVLLKMPVLPNDVVSNVPDITSTDLNPQDVFVIVACDGLWDVINDQQAVDLVRDCRRELAPLARQLEAEGRSEAEVLARMLVEEALARGSDDNISCVVVFL
jgi:serine/threonine protein phosphatase PrpC